MKKYVLVLMILGAVVCCKGRRAGASGEPGQDADSIPTVAPDTAAAATGFAALPEEPVFDIVTNMGTIKVKLYKDTPRHRANFAKLAISGYYDSLLFHRVISGFMIQGGDPFTRDTALVELYGQGGPAYTVPMEMPLDAEGHVLHRHKKGALCAARRSDVANPFRESSGSQFYLVQDPDHCVHLDSLYTVFGETVAGLNVIDRISEVKTDRYERPVRDVRIITIKPDEELNSANGNQD